MMKLRKLVLTGFIGAALATPAAAQTTLDRKSVV